MEASIRVEGKAMTDTSTPTAAGAGNLTIHDPRTGSDYELPIDAGTIRAIDLRKIKSGPADFGLMTYDPGFTNTAACKSAITWIDGDAGVLLYRGYPIEQLAERSTFTEVASLLLRGEMPSEGDHRQWCGELARLRAVPAAVEGLVGAFPAGAHPMGILISAVAALSALNPDAKHVGNPEMRHEHAHRLIAQVPTLAALAFRRSTGRPPVAPDPARSYVGDLLHMLFSGEAEKASNPVLERALDVLFILHADHEQNCSTSAVRGVGSSGADPYSSVAAGMGALYGPLHGGANEAVLAMLREIRTVDRVPEFMARVERGERRLMGFGHRVYHTYDPRAKIIRRTAEDVFAETGINPLLEVALELERRALQDAYFIERHLYPNVDFYSGLIYEAMGFPAEMFTVLFAIARTSGWVAQWLESREDPDLKIARPRQVYSGPARRELPGARG
ncbi:MAG: citrate synthase [Candidatus Dormibacterales bacterium]